MIKYLGSMHGLSRLIYKINHPNIWLQGAYETPLEYLGAVENEGLELRTQVRRCDCHQSKSHWRAWHRWGRKYTRKRGWEWNLEERLRKRRLKHTGKGSRRIRRAHCCGNQRSWFHNKGSNREFQEMRGDQRVGRQRTVPSLDKGGKQDSSNVICRPAPGHTLDRLTNR